MDTLANWLRACRRGGHAPLGLVDWPARPEARIMRGPFLGPPARARPHRGGRQLPSAPTPLALVGRRAGRHVLALMTGGVPLCCCWAGLGWAARLGLDSALCALRSALCGIRAAARQPSVVRPPPPSTRADKPFAHIICLVRRLWHQKIVRMRPRPQTYETTQRPPENENPASLPPCLRSPPTLPVRPCFPSPPPPCASSPSSPPPVRPAPPNPARPLTSLPAWNLTWPDLT